MAAPAPQLPSHGYVITKPVRGSEIPVDLTFVLTRDEIYVPIAVRKPPGNGPFPAITMARGNGRGGMPFVEAQVERLASLQDRIIQRGYVVATVNYRNEIPLAYGSAERSTESLRRHDCGRKNAQIGREPRFRRPDRRLRLPENAAVRETPMRSAR